MRMKRISVYLFIGTVLAVAMGPRLDAQNPARLFGTTSGNPIALLATAGGLLRVSVDGGAFTNPITLPSGTDCTAGTIPISFTSDTNTGIGNFAADTLNFCTGGTQRLGITSTAVTSTVPYLGPTTPADGTAPSYSFTGDTNTGMDYVSADEGALVAGGARIARYSTTYFQLNQQLQFLTDAFISRKAAASFQFGLDAAGVTNQIIQSPTRITSDGVGANFTFAAGPGRGAAGGSLIFQTAPAAGAGVTGTLATALTIAPTGNATFAAGTTTTVADLVSTDPIQALRYKLGTTLAISSVAPTAAGTGMAFTVGTGSTSFDWSITITTANAQSAFTLTLPTASNAWTCQAQSLTNPGSMKISVSSRTTSTVVLTQYSQTTGLAAAFADNDVIIGTCTAH